MTNLPRTFELHVLTFVLVFFALSQAALTIATNDAASYRVPVVSSIVLSALAIAIQILAFRRSSTHPIGSKIVSRCCVVAFSLVAGMILVDGIRRLPYVFPDVSKVASEEFVDLQ